MACLSCLVVARSVLRGGSVVAFSFRWWRVLALVPSWQDVARRRTRSERGKAEKGGAVASRQAVKMPI